MGDTKRGDHVNIDELRGQLDGVLMDLAEILEKAQDDTEDQARMVKKVLDVVMKALYGEDWRDSDLPF